MSQQIGPLNKEQVGRLYDYLHSQWAEARDGYRAAGAGAAEEFYRGRWEAMDDIIIELDVLVDEGAGDVR